MTELADIFQTHGDRYQRKYGNRILPSQRAAMQAILACRTEVLGGHIYVCQSCDETQYSYHSCQNRHCPKCQHGDGEEWLEKQQALLLPVPYFLLTFTLPSDLRQLTRKPFITCSFVLLLQQLRS
ncbi:MAG: transposase zinc-binding domain-containing protein [Anaerolineales bacterium]